MAGMRVLATVCVLLAAEAKDPPIEVGDVFRDCDR